MIVIRNQLLSTVKDHIAKGTKSLSISGLSGSAFSFFFSQLLALFERPCLVLLPSRKEAERFHNELRFFLSVGDHSSPSPAGARLHQFPPYDMSPLAGLSPHREIVAQRIRSMYALTSEKAPVVVSSFEAVFFRVLPKESLVKALEFLEVGEELDRETLLQKLETIGYQRTSLVEEKGDYSVRGGVIDLFSPLYESPVRLEFWGERIESMRQFDPLSQRSQNKIHELVVTPANEIMMGEDNMKRARSMGRLPAQAEASAGFPGQEAWLNHFYPRLDALLQYLPQDGLLTLVDSHRMESLFKGVHERFEKDVDRFRKEAAERRTPFPEVEGLLVPLQETTKEAENRQRLLFSELDLGQKEASRDAIRIEGHFDLDADLEIRLANKGRVSLAPLAQKVSEWLASRAKVVLVSRTEQQANRIREILSNYDVPTGQVVSSWQEVPDESGLTICLGRLSKGFTWHEIGLYVVSEDEVFGPKRTGAKTRDKSGVKPLNWSSFSQLKAGDLVVHEEHGIGRYDSLCKMEIGKNINDFVIIEYAGNGRLYIPVDRISILQKYVGADEGNAKLDQLGGRSWNLVKQKAKKSIRKIAKQLIELYALRTYRRGFEFSPPDHYYREFEATFEHEETPDQMKVFEDVLQDMISERPMDRLICGDVGFGKTEVAIRAAFKAVLDGKQVAVLVPTTVLAEQHYEEFKKRMEPFSVHVGMLSRFKTRSEQVEVVARVRSGKIDVLIGTHRILQKDVQFRDLGLLIVDEEQRFGVKQKEVLKKYRALVDVLAITATPIPRTLQMSMMGVRDLSIIETPPKDRLDIQTYLSPYDENIIVRAIQLELERGGQVFFVHNRVQTIGSIADRLRSMVPRGRFAVAHGQMKARELEMTMMRFLKREIDVLVCTTIIESGLDIAAANTIIINEVDRLGLAQIYQLRGRVGRSKEEAYAYLLLSNGSNLTRDTEKRLKALMDFSHLGAGLHLAMHDLKIRGGGNILGFSQSGHISAIGYELYLKLIERAIAELKGEDWHEEVNPEINMNISAFLPEDYVIDTDVRLNLYRRLSGLREEGELKAMTEEIQDRFGPLPREAQNLLGIMSIRLRLKNMGISRLDVGRDGLILTFSPETQVDTEGLVQFVGNKGRSLQFMAQNKLKMRGGPFSLPEDIPRIEEAIGQLDFARRKSWTNEISPGDNSTGRVLALK